jgi:hypothetical protein
MRKKILTVLLFIACLIPAAFADCDLGLKTYDQTAWGTSPSGNNSAAYRNAHFPTAFPAGIVIGKNSGYTATFTNSKAVQLFLPTTGTAKPFNQSSINATSSSAGILGGEVLSLALNVGFDNADPAFASSAQPLGQLVVSDGFCAGMTVQQVLDEANLVLSGGASSFTPAQIQNCTLQINKNFLNGSVDNGHLACVVAPVVNVSINVTGNDTPVVNISLNESVNNTPANASVPENVSANVSVNATENVTGNGSEIMVNSSLNLTENMSVNASANTTQNVTEVPSNATPVQNATNSTMSNVSANNGSVSSAVNVSIAPWYPKNMSYVFFCNTNFTATNYSWYFGDGEKLVQIKNWNVYHTYKRSGIYQLRCTAFAAGKSENATLQVAVV